MIYDCFIFYNEYELLELRINELSSIKDLVHVIVQADKTFTGNKKTIHEFDNPRIMQVNVTNMPDNCDAWTREIYQRNSIMKGLINANNNDIVVVSDADEIPALSAVEKFNTQIGMASLKMDNFWYKFNCLTERQTWTPAKIMSYKYLSDKTPNEVRNSGSPFVINYGGWHFSYLGDANFIINKIQSFSHQEFNQEQYTDKKEITKKIDDGISLWGNSQFSFINIDETFPKYLFENQSKFKHLIKKL